MQLKFLRFYGSLVCLCIGLVTACVVDARSTTEKFQAPIFNNLGNFHFPITTKNPDAQRFFDQGLILFYAFEWGESIRSFKEATRLDPNCAMCYWGLALSLGNKINAPMTGHEYQDAKSAIETATTLSVNATPREQDYIKALTKRFQHPAKHIDKERPFHCHGHVFKMDTSTQQEMLDYANALKSVVEKYPNDMDAKALYAGALFWNLVGTKPSFENPYVQKAFKTLQAAVAKDKNHIGINHYYIHMIEPFAHPEEALPSAILFKTAVPGSEHLVHMPAHIYFLIGRYHEATDANFRAIEVYKQYNQTVKNQGFEPEINYLYFHNYDFLRSSATMEGRKQLALTAAEQMVAEPFPTWLKNEDALQWFIPIPSFVNARFGLWDEIIEVPMPLAKYQYAVGMWHYTRGLAYLHAGDVKKAEEEIKKMHDIIQKGEVDANLGKQGHSVLNIAYEVLSAKIADAQGKESEVFTHLKKAAAIQDDMGYHEPPDWYFPVKTVMGDAYLKWNHPKEALLMYQQALKAYPKNGWILFGMAKSLRKLNKIQEAERVEKEFAESWKNADIPVPILMFQ